MDIDTDPWLAATLLLQLQKKKKRGKKADGNFAGSRPGGGWCVCVGGGGGVNFAAIKQSLVLAMIDTCLEATMQTFRY